MSIPYLVNECTVIHELHFLHTGLLIAKRNCSENPAALTAAQMQGGWGNVCGYPLYIYGSQF